MNKQEQKDPTKNIVLPGDKIAVIEEYLPGETCYERDGSIYSSHVGEVATDPRKHKISVNPVNSYFEIKKEDRGIGRVLFVKKQIASVDIYKLNRRDVGIPINTILHVSDTSRRFVKNMFEVTRPGDWLRFRVLRTGKVIYISLVGEDLGVIQSFCNRCGYELKLIRRNTLECPNCEYVQPRITSRQYGAVI